VAALADPHGGQVALLAYAPDRTDVQAEDASGLSGRQQGRCLFGQPHDLSIVTRPRLLFRA